MDFILKNSTLVSFKNSTNVKKEKLHMSSSKNAVSNPEVVKFMDIKWHKP